MLSRAAWLSAQNRNVLAIAARSTTTSSPNSAPAGDGPSSSVPRPIRQEPGKVRMGFIPDEWFTFFYKKTGVTGPYTFGAALATYLVSKEIYVMEHEYYTGLSVLLMCYVACKKFGPGVAKALDKEIDEYEASWNENRKEQHDYMNQSIEDEKKMQWSQEGQQLLVEAKRENVALQLEAAFRARQMQAYQEVKRLLDYQVERRDVERRAAHRNIIDYVVRKVKASITPDQEKQNIDKCIADLAALAKA